MEISKKVVKLLCDTYEVSNGFVRSFYSSFDVEGNVIICDNRNGEYRITRGMLGADNPVGVVNRVPLQLHLDGITYNGCYICNCCTDNAHNVKSIMQDMVENANCDVDFTIVVPKDEEEYAFYTDMGYGDCVMSPFPAKVNREELEKLSLCDAQCDFHSLYRLDNKNNCDGYTFSGAFTAFVMNTLKDYRIDYIKRGDSVTGYVIWRENGEFAEICDMYCNCDAEECVKAFYENVRSQPHRKSMYRCNLIKFDKTLPALNRCGEY